MEIVPVVGLPVFLLWQLSRSGPILGGADYDQ
jgi:hypothetical protein